VILVTPLLTLAVVRGFPLAILRVILTVTEAFVVGMEDLPIDGDVPFW
jgi:hypothetical protein